MCTVVASQKKIRRHAKKHAAEVYNFWEIFTKFAVCEIRNLLMCVCVKDAGAAVAE